MVLLQPKQGFHVLIANVAVCDCRSYVPEPSLLKVVRLMPWLNQLLCHSTWQQQRMR